ncbi:HEPN domain-containing protein [Brevibacillus dissolubilis]|uniref:HEPN domain-containing protein n=1 Tax=Brevibacillus dissolubilis TaxID=1844116 RepID=UPI001115E47A|nr:HEPN domain-containing protein [Brevibacillus dissolubilis]
MPLLLAPVFNSLTEEPVQIDLGQGFQMISGNERLYQFCRRYLRTAMNENKLHFENKIKPNSLFLLADYPEMKVTDEHRGFVSEIENRLNVASTHGVGSIPYLLHIDESKTKYAITYLKRSLDGDKLTYTGSTREIFEGLLRTENTFPPVPYRRYALSLEKESYEDQLLDLWIALESLFVPDGKKGEITYKVRLRLAYYFGATPDERKKLAAFIKTSYNHRSEIAHSGKILGSKLKEEIAILRRIVRATLINMYTEGVSVQDMRERLDELVLSGKSYPEVYQPDFFVPMESKP